MGTKQTVAGTGAKAMPPPTPKKFGMLKGGAATKFAKPAKVAKPLVKVAQPAAKGAKGKGKGELPGKGVTTAPAVSVAPTTVEEFAQVMETVAEQTGIKPAELPADPTLTVTFDVTAPAPVDAWKAPHKVGAVAMLDTDDIDADPKRNGRPLDMRKVKQYAVDFAARIKAGDEPQLQELTAYYDGGLVGDERDKPRLVFGFHRAHAAMAYNAGKTGMDRMLVRVRIVPTPAGAKGLLDNYAENSLRSELSPVADMRYMARLRDEHGMGQKETAVAMRVSPTLVSLRLSLERLPAKVLDMVESGALPVKAAYQLAGMDNPEQRVIAIDGTLRALDELHAVAQGEGKAVGDAAGVAPVVPIKVEAVAAAIDAAKGKAPKPVKAKGKRGPKTAADKAAQVTPSTPAPSPATAATPSPNSAIDGPKKLSVGRVERELQSACMFAGTPKPLKEVLRAQLQWLMGMKTTDKMLRTVAASLGVDITGLAIPGLATK